MTAALYLAFARNGWSKSELVVVWHWWRVLYRVDWCWYRIQHLEGSAESVLAQVEGSVQGGLVLVQNPPPFHPGSSIGVREKHINDIWCLVVCSINNSKRVDQVTIHQFSA